MNTIIRFAAILIAAALTVYLGVSWVMLDFSWPVHVAVEDREVSVIFLVFMTAITSMFTL